MDNIFYRNDKLNGELKAAALGQIAGALGSFEKAASNCPDREEAGTGKYCKRSREMSPTVLEVFRCAPCLWAWCPRVPQSEREEFLNSPAEERG